MPSSTSIHVGDRSGKYAESLVSMAECILYCYYEIYKKRTQRFSVRSVLLHHRIAELITSVRATVGSTVH